MAGKDFFAGFEKIDVDVDGARIHAMRADSGPPALLHTEPE
jgi:hypothetical protein